MSGHTPTPEAAVPLWRQVIRLHRANPSWGATRIAHALGKSDAYVRAVAQRRDLALPRSNYAEVPTHGAAYSAKRRTTLASYSELVEALERIANNNWSDQSRARHFAKEALAKVKAKGEAL